MAELKKYNVGATISFPLVATASESFATSVTFAAGDHKISKDGGGFANTVNVPAHLGEGIFTLALTATELQAARIVITVRDQTAPKVWQDQAIYVETYGNASAEHAFDLDTATVVASDLTDKTGMALTAAEHTAIADEIWDELRAGHVIGGSFGEGAASVQGNVTGSVASVTGSVSSVAGNVVGTIGDLAAAAKASVNAELDTALVDINLDHFMDVTGTVNDVTPAANNFDTDLASAADDFYNGRRLKFVSGALAGQERRIADYAGGTKNVILGAAYTSIPANGDAFVLLPSVEGALTAAGIWDELEGAEPGAVIGGNASMRIIMQTLKRRFTNKATQTAFLFTQFKDDSTTVLHNQVTSFDGTTQSKSRAS
jgi:hypothetical protein